LTTQIKIRASTIVVFCPNWVGDVVMATPAFDCLRQNFPQARIIGAVRPYAKGVVADGPWFDQLVDLRDKTFAGFLQAVRRLRADRPEMGMVLPNSWRSALIARLAGVRRVYGYRRNGRSFLLTGGPRPVRNGRHILPVPTVGYYLQLCAWLNLALPESAKPSLFVSAELERQAQALLERYEITADSLVIGMNPGARFGSSKCWPPQYFAQLAELLSRRWRCKILLFVGPGEDQLGDWITANSRAAIINTGPDRVNLGLLKPLIKRCQLLITNDTGPRHYAVAFDVPVVVIMGPTDPRYTHANLEKTVVLRQDLDCSPCHRKQCPRDHQCMVSIVPETVLNVCEQLLGDLG
jgi:heptosyltransferase-2